MKKQIPNETSEKVDANLRQPGTHEGRNRADGTPYDEGTEELQSEQSNALSNDLRGSTQFVNLDTSEIPEDNHEQPDSENTVNRPLPEAETKLADNEPVDKTGEDNAGK